MRAYPPLRDDHPIVGTTCPYCENTFEPGDVVALVEQRPASPADAKKARAGHAYTAEAGVFHYFCAIALSPPDETMTLHINEGPIHSTGTPPMQTSAGDNDVGPPAGPPESTRPGPGDPA